MNNNAASFFWKAARSIPVDSEASGLLASHFVININKACLPKTICRETVSCQHCGNIWNERPYKVGIKPKKNVAKCIKKILRRHERNPDCLRSFEKNFVKRFQSNCNKVILTCPVCSKKTEIPLVRQNPVPVVVSEAAGEQSKKKKKKRNKDKMCGLKMTLVEPRVKKEKPPSSPQISNTTSSVATTSEPSKPGQASQTSNNLKHKPNLQASNCKSNLQTSINKIQTSKPKHLDMKSKNKNKKSFDPNVIKKIMSKSSVKHSLKDFLNSLP